MLALALGRATAMARSPAGLPAGCIPSLGCRAAAGQHDTAPRAPRCARLTGERPRSRTRGDGRASPGDVGRRGGRNMTARTQTALTRRQALALSASAGAALMLPGVGHAKMPTGLPQAPTFYRFKLGSAECTVVTDGQLPLGDPKKSFTNISGEEIDRELRDNFLPLNNAVLEQNVLIVNFGDRVVLFDTGMGTDKLFGDSTGKMLATMRQAGIAPANVDAVVMSHAHIDHCGGLLADSGSHNFPNAQCFI